MIHLADRRKEYRTHMVDRLAKCDRELGKLARKATARQPKYTARAKPPRDPVHTVLSDPLPQIRDHATLLYHILAQNWNCSGHNPHTATKLRLPTYRSDKNEARFEMIFRSASDVSCKWQESEVRLIPRNKYGILCCSMLLLTRPL
jgi:hypothetical protein